MRGNDRTRRCGWLPRLALGASISLGAAVAAPAERPVTLAPGESLAAALELDAHDYWVALDGALPRPLAGAPRPGPGDHLILLLRPEHGELAPAGWRAVTVAGGEGTLPSPTARLVIDRTPPRASFFVTGPHLGKGDSLRLAPSAGLRIRFSDLSGVTHWQASDRHPGSSNAGRWLPGRHRLSVVAGDTAGNFGPSGELEFQVDADGPAIGWRIVNPGLAQAGGERVYRAPVTLEVSASDPSGVQGFEALIDDRWQPLAGDRITIAADSLELRASDRLGNLDSTAARWRYDTQGPAITVHAPVGEVRESSALLPVNGILAVTVSDPGAGVGAARYRYNRKPFRPLPKRIRFVDRGRYLLEIQATDRLGNQTTAQWKVRTKRWDIAGGQR